ncbi:VWA domain-containing protein [Agromyces sp. MMS24-K17]|uniref:DUF7927 domain-containing protein n=1 Tax=Agromyces sp. MMS24-K17 TaxID=3372850 RepID=UPI003753FF56
MINPALRRPRKPHRPTGSRAAIAALVVAGLISVGAPSLALAEGLSRTAETAAVVEANAPDAAGSGGEASSAEASASESAASGAGVPEAGGPADAAPAGEGFGPAPIAKEAPGTEAPGTDAPDGPEPGAEVPSAVAEAGAGDGDPVPGAEARSSARAAAAAVDPRITPNPDLQDACGIDVAFVLDKSKSLGASGIVSLKSATNAFAAALVDTGSQVSITAFDQDATVLLPATDLTSAGLPAIRDSYAGLEFGGYTNWKRGLQVGHETFPGFADGRAELTIVITDGLPNTVDPSKPAEFPDGSFAAVAPAVLQANDVKLSGSHVLVVAVGPEVALPPIEAISSPVEFDGDDIRTAGYVTSTDYSTLADDLAGIAHALCGGTVTIHKEIDGEPVPGWEFSTDAEDVAPAVQRTGETGATQPFRVGGFEEPTRTIEFTEEHRPFHSFESVVCEDSSGAPVPSSRTGDLTFAVEVAIDAIVHCTVVNDAERGVWKVTKSSDPPSGSTVAVGDRIEYTLAVEHVSGPKVTDLDIDDDISQLAPFVTFDGFVGTPPLEYDWDGLGEGRLRLKLAALEEGQVLQVRYVVTVAADTPPGTVLRNRVLTACAAVEGPAVPDGSSSAVAQQDPCTTEHLLPGVRIEKLWEHDGGPNPVDSGDTPPDVITYTLHVWNDGSGPVHAPVVGDVLPEGTAFVPGSEVLPEGWELDDSVDGGVGFVQAEPGAFAPVAYPGLEFRFDVRVGELAHPDLTVPIPDLVNDACVVAGLPPAGEQGEGEAPGALAAVDPDPELLAAGLAACADATTPVKSVAIDGFAQCVNDTPWFEYSVTPYNLSAPLPAVALIWWTTEAYAAHDPSIEAGDEAAILADGASQVDYLAVPAGWEPGDAITGRQLWPGAAIDADGNPIDWPGWTLLPDGTWILDPDAPFYDLREDAVVEIRVNPSSAEVTAYPPPTPDCNAAPRNTTATANGGGLAGTGADPVPPVLLGGALLLLGAVALGARTVARRRAE